MVVRSIKFHVDNKSGEGSIPSWHYPPPFCHGAAGSTNMPPMYYPPFYPIWGYSYPQWPQQPYTAMSTIYPPCSSDTGHPPIDRGESDAPREETKGSHDPVGSSCNVETDGIHDASVTDTSPESKTEEPQLSLSCLKRDYSSTSSSDNTAPNSPTHHHDNSNRSSPQQSLDISSFEQQVMEFTSRRSKMIRSIKAKPLSLPADNSSTGNQLLNMRCLLLENSRQKTLHAWNH